MGKLIRLIIVSAVILTGIFGFCACGSVSSEEMPFNGEIQFHDIGLTVPETFIRDSTESNEDFWVFEHGGYEKYILLSREDAGDFSPKKYAAAMEDVGAECEYVKKGSTDAVISRVTNEKNEYCQELCFLYGDSRYAVALRGSTDDEFMHFINTISFTEQ